MNPKKYKISSETPMISFFKICNIAVFTLAMEMEYEKRHGYGKGEGKMKIICFRQIYLGLRRAF